MKIWLDDERSAPDGWRWIAHARDVIVVLLANPGNITEISLDNDLGNLHGESLEGCHVAKLILALAVAGMLPPIKLHVHSANPIAARRIQGYFDDTMKVWGSDASKS